MRGIEDSLCSSGSVAVVKENLPGVLVGVAKELSTDCTLKPTLTSVYIYTTDDIT